MRFTSGGCSSLQGALKFPVDILYMHPILGRQVNNIVYNINKINIILQHIKTKSFYTEFVATKIINFSMKKGDSGL